MEYVLIRVVLPQPQQSNKEIVYFERQLRKCDLTLSSVEDIVKVLHTLFIGVSHEIQIRYQYV